MLKILTINDKCTACMACYSICPKSAITMKEDEEGFLYPLVDENLCDKCQLCEDVCPELENHAIEGHREIQKSYYGFHANDFIRKKSSSGGVFSGIAEKILEKGGLVFGAVYDGKQKTVEHRSTNDNKLEQLRKSKYVQSFIGESFKNVKKYLNFGKKVLFIGTPCQVKGLINYYNHNNLITCDFICHGVPPMKLLYENITYLEKKHKKKIIGLDFRPKIKTWTYDYFSITTNTGKTINIPWNYDSYFKGFIDNLTLRKSCYQCRYSSNQHISDITIADFWGYRRYDKKIYDNRGISLIIVNTKKGEELINSISLKTLELKPLKWEYANYVFSKRDGDIYNKEKRDDFLIFTKDLGMKKQ